MLCLLKEKYYLIIISKLGCSCWVRRGWHRLDCQKLSHLCISLSRLLTIKVPLPTQLPIHQESVKLTFKTVWSQIIFLNQTNKQLSFMKTLILKVMGTCHYQWIILLIFIIYNWKCIILLIRRMKILQWKWQHRCHQWESVHQIQLCCILFLHRILLLLRWLIHQQFSKRFQ